MRAIRQMFKKFEIWFNENLSFFMTNGNKTQRYERQTEKENSGS